MIGIYKFENRYTHQIYIGQSVRIERRYEQHREEAELMRSQSKFYEALHGHFEDFDFEILEECLPEELNERERYWIAYYDSFHNGLNSNEGGLGGIYDRTEIFELWDQGFSVGEIAKELGCVSETVRCWLQGYKNYSIVESNRRGGLKARATAIENGNSISTDIYQFSLDGNLIAHFSSKKEAARITGIDENSIRRVINRERVSAGGFVWQDTDVFIPPKKIGGGIAHEVHQYSLTDEYIATYPSYTAAAKAMGRTDTRLIRRVCNDATKTAYGYRWKN